MSWKPPTESEFNEWFTPNDALEGDHSHFKKRSVLEQLRAGLLIAVARNAQIAAGTSASPERFVRILVGPWRRLSDADEEYFWKSGNLIVEDRGSTGYGGDGTQRYLDVRFDPKSFSGKPLGEGDEGSAGREVQPIPMAAAPSPPAGGDAVLNALMTGLSPNEPAEIPPFRFAELVEYEASVAPKIALKSFPYEVELANRQLHRELIVGRVVAIAHEAIWSEGTQTMRAGLLVVPTWVWRYEPKTDADFWDTGYLECSLPMKGYGFDSSRWIKLYDVRFWPEGLPETKASDKPIKEVSVPAKGGRPPKPFWDELWAEIVCQVYTGKLIPEKQSDIERAMLEWATSREEKLSEMSARTAARKVISAIAREDKN